MANFLQFLLQILEHKYLGHPPIILLSTKDIHPATNTHHTKLHMPNRIGVFPCHPVRLPIDFNSRGILILAVPAVQNDWVSEVDDSAGAGDAVGMVL